ncbi:MAG: NUDIX hydrolase [Firmicutes bacterium]|nr:NUDIX hydrolase [Bacillota bacterium]MBQ4060722.1 NUDIX hydrolase [Bacilli bacterium]
MSSLGRNYNNYLETLISIFTIDKGALKVLLLRKKTEPYKGYWILPGNILRNDETLEDNITDAVLDKTGLLSVYIEQCYTFSNIDRDPDGRVIATSFIGLVDSKSVEIKREERPEFETAWFSIDELPKLGYDHESIISRNIDYLKRKIVNSNVLKSLFPSDFTLPELQHVYEQILGRELDRRNFRKKFIGLDLIEDTLEKNVGFNGRPAKLYRFKDDIKEINLF